MGFFEGRKEGEEEGTDEVRYHKQMNENRKSICTLARKRNEKKQKEQKKQQSE